MKNPLKNYGIFGWNYYCLIFHPWMIFNEAYYQVKWFIQRGRRGYADCDVWSLDYYLAGWLPKALTHLQDNNISHPTGMTSKGWKTRLEIMKQGFLAVQKMNDIPCPSTKELLKLKRIMDKGVKMFGEHFQSLWD